MSADHVTQALAEPVLHKVASEIRYAEGIVYLDRCGSVTRDLQKVVGKGFVFGLPKVEQGELTSAGERIAVRYGPESLSVIQDGAESLARFTQISTWSWQTLGPALEVNRKVTRCGFRFQFLYATQSIEDAEAFLSRSGLATETPSWVEVFGAATARQHIAKMSLPGWEYLGVQLGVIRMELNGKMSPEMEKFYPAASVHLDLDFVLRDGEPQEFRHTELKESILRAWRTAQDLGKRVRERCIQ